ncbi:hypothetical protein M758_UG162700 [Ceratodon purpureus]|nr:hypothetical protein M758_UG162700 [Ceratodon purpureus]
MLEEIYMLSYRHELEKPTLTSLIVTRALERMGGIVLVRNTLRTASTREIMDFRKKEVWRTYGGFRNLTTMFLSSMQGIRREKKVRSSVIEMRHQGKEGKPCCKERG